MPGLAALRFLSALALVVVEAYDVRALDCQPTASDARAFALTPFDYIVIGMLSKNLVSACSHVSQAEGMAAWL